MAGDIFTLDADNNAAVRTVPVNAAASETNSPVIFTTDEDGNTAVRTVSVNAGASETNSPVIFTTDEDGNAAVRVVGAGGGSAPVIDELNVTPSTSAQTITAPSGTDGYSPVNVAAVTSAIDANIVAGNIKKDVEILGVTGSYEGQAPTGTMYIISNGTYNVADKAIANVQVPTTAPAHYVKKNTYGTALGVGTETIDLTGITDIMPYALSRAYYWTTSSSKLTGVALKNADSLTAISGVSAMEDCFNGQDLLTSTGLNNVKTISGTSALTACFFGCLALPSIDMDNLESLTGPFCLARTFGYCSNLTVADFPKLSTISVNNCFGQNAFNSIFIGCTKLQNIYFRAFKASTFSSLQTQLQFLCGSTTGSQATGGCTVHFPSNFDPSDPDHTFDASTLTGYPTFGGDANYIHVAFDLPATE